MLSSEFIHHHRFQQWTGEEGFSVERMSQCGEDLVRSHLALALALASSSTEKILYSTIQ